MVSYYRLKELDFRLASGAHVLPRGAFEPVEAASALLERAREEATRIVEAARAEFQSERKRGYEEGLAQARLEAVGRLVEENNLLERKILGIEKELTEIVVAGIRRLVNEFDDRAKAESIVRAALRQMRREKKAELRVSPAQHAEMKASIDNIAKEFPELELVDVVEDATLVAPQIIIETSIGRVEGDLGRGMEELEHILRGAVRGMTAQPDVALAREAAS
jgi:type III secretion protein L